MDIYQSGLDQLCQKSDAARLQAQVVSVGMEPTSHSFKNLARHLLDHFQPVKLVNSFSVKQNREQQCMRREKTDQIDAAAVASSDMRRSCSVPE
ncbi:MAG: transposase [Anaerolineales bacterium]|nr:transposase [Anaerolineales bacterium]